MHEQVPDVFISYSSKDRAWVSDLAKALEASGFSVWWDRDLIAGENFLTKIEEMLDKAGCVITVWSEDAVKSDWVIPESQRAVKRNVWVPLLYKPTRIPVAFEMRQNADLQAWKGSVGEDCFKSLLRAVEKVLGRLKPATDDPVKQGFLHETWNQLSSTNNKLNLLVATAFFGVGMIAIIGLFKLMTSTPSGPLSAKVNKGNCSGDISGDITGAVVTFDCSTTNKE